MGTDLVSLSIWTPPRICSFIEVNVNCVVVSWRISYLYFCSALLSPNEVGISWTLSYVVNGEWGNTVCKILQCDCERKRKLLVPSSLLYTSWCVLTVRAPGFPFFSGVLTVRASECGLFACVFWRYLSFICWCVLTVSARDCRLLHLRILSRYESFHLPSCFSWNFSRLEQVVKSSSLLFLSFLFLPPSRSVLMNTRCWVQVRCCVCVCVWERERERDCIRCGWTFIVWNHEWVFAFNLMVSSYTSFLHNTIFTFAMSGAASETWCQLWKCFLLNVNLITVFYSEM